MNRLSLGSLGLAFLLLLLAVPLGSAATNAVPALRVDGSTAEAMALTVRAPATASKRMTHRRGRHCQRRATTPRERRGLVTSP